VPGKVVGSVDDGRFTIIQTTAAHYLHHQEVYKKSYR